MKITVLGCGSSGGVPLIGNNWGACDPSNIRNRRLRVSILIEDGDTTVLVDTSPDMRQQLLACNLQKLDAVLFTHAHADHCHGIDELRSVNWLTQKPIDIYADAVTLENLKARFAYIFGAKNARTYYKPAVVAHEISTNFEVGSLKVSPFAQDHGSMRSLGYRFGEFAYSTDVHTMDETGFAALEGVKIWLVDCVRDDPHPTHSHLKQTLEWIARVKPEQAYLTHMGQTLDYNDLVNRLPAGVLPAHDGLVIQC